jgi:hypothetical protein
VTGRAQLDRNIGHGFRSESVAYFSEMRKGNTLKFEVNGQQYFLGFVEQENQRYVFAPTPTGMNRIPVYVDAVKWKMENSAELNRLSS